MTTHRSAERPGPPMPRAAYRIVNPLMKAVLRSPLHGLLSASLMVLSFRGRKSGTGYHIPVGYLQGGKSLFVFSHGAWSNNFRGGAPVEVRLRGKQLRGTARIIEDRERIAEIVGMLVSKHGHAMARRMGLALDGQPTPRGVTFVEIGLEEVAP